MAEWVSSKPIRAWAAINPALAGIDLRPYLFVTKDRKDYFGAASVLGHLTTIIEHLLGPKITVQALETDLRRLAPPEAEKVFDAVRERVIGSDEFDREPPGVAGLVVLVKAHPMLQANLIDFLEGLPVDHLGPWAVKGWEGVIREVELVARLDRLIGSWATSSKNALLKAAAAATRKIVQGGR